MRGLQGSWKIERKLKSVRKEYPTGIFTGTASFHPRASTDSTYDFEYLYTENGQLTTDQGFSLTAHRCYVYRYVEETDMISVWFVKQDGKRPRIKKIAGLVGPPKATISATQTSIPPYMCFFSMGWLWNALQSTTTSKVPRKITLPRLHIVARCRRSV